MKKIKTMIISAAFLALNKLALDIAHPLLRQMAQHILSDAAEFARLMTENDLTDPSVAASVFAAQQPVARPMAVMPDYVPQGIAPSTADVPRTVRRK
jgi:hypothetical protein